MTDQADQLVVERSIKASPATVFSYFSSEERWTAWQGASATIEAWPGGMFRMLMPGGEIASGQFVEVVPNRRIVFTWGWEGENHPVPPGSSTLEIDLLPEAAGTRLRPTHRGLAQPFIDHHHEGWQQYLARLIVVAERGQPHPDPNAAPKPSRRMVPLAVPALVAGATGPDGEVATAGSVVVVALAALLGLAGTVMWWLRADQTN